MTTPALETSEEKRISSAGRLVKLFTVMGPGFHGLLLFALFIASCVAFAKGTKNAFNNSTSEGKIDLSFNTYAWYLALAAGAAVCFVPVTIVTARASCLSKGAQLGINFVHREVLRTLWVIVPLIIIGWVPPKEAGPSVFGAFCFTVMPGSPENNAGKLAVAFIHWTMFHAILVSFVGHALEPRATPRELVQL